MDFTYCDKCKSKVMATTAGNCPSCGTPLPILDATEVATREAKATAEAKENERRVAAETRTRRKRRVIAGIFAVPLLVFAALGVFSFLGALFSGFRPWIGDGGQLVFHMGIAAIAWSIMDKRRRRPLIAFGILAICGGLAVRRSFAERHFDVRKEDGRYVATYGGMTIGMATNVAHQEVIESALLQLSHRRVAPSLLHGKALTILHYESRANFMMNAGIGSTEVSEQVYLLYDKTYFMASMRVAGDGRRSSNPFKQASEGLWRAVIGALPALAKGDCPGCHNKANWTTCKCCGVSYCSRCTPATYLHAAK